MKRMLINATHSEELRVALVDGQKLYDLDIEPTTREQKKANIYKGKVTRVEPSLEAAFVDFGAERHGFLPLKEVAREYFTNNSDSRPAIKDALKEGQEIILQVEKEERGNKGAAISTFISLAGRYLVLMPNNPKAGGISRRIEGDDRDQLRDVVKDLKAPEHMGYIIRTAGIGRSVEELQLDLDYLIQLWDAIQRASENNKAPLLIYQESNVVIRAIRDYLRQDIDEVLIDDQKTYQEVYDFVEQVIPNFLGKIKLYQNNIPLFSRYQIESQIESAFEREVKLPSGGSIVIDPTEALVSIDINSARSTKGGDIEETALNTNLEAADEIARQLRLRDMGGLLVIDFIDMSSMKNQRAVENRMRDALSMDRARVQVGKISRFGLMELSRQRLRPSLGETSGITCPRCKGQGTIRDIPSTALSVMRLLEEEALKDSVHQIHAQLPVDVATYLLNEKREAVLKLENRLGVRILIIPNVNLESPNYEVSRVKENGNVSKASYEMADEIAPPENEGLNFESNINRQQQAAVSMIPPRVQGAQEKQGLMAKLLAWFSDESESNQTEQKPQKQQNKNNNKSRNNRDNNRNQQNNRNPNQKQNNRNNRNRNDKNRNDNNRNDRDKNTKERNENNRNSGQNNKQGNKQENNQRNDRNDRNNDKKERKEASGNNSNRNRRDRNNDKRREQRQEPVQETESKNQNNNVQQEQKSNSQVEAQANEVSKTQSAAISEQAVSQQNASTPEQVVTAANQNENADKMEQHEINNKADVIEKPLETAHSTNGHEKPETSSQQSASVTQQAETPAQQAAATEQKQTEQANSAPNAVVEQPSQEQQHTSVNSTPTEQKPEPVTTEAEQEKTAAENHVSDSSSTGEHTQQRASNDPRLNRN